MSKTLFKISCDKYLKELSFIEENGDTSQGKVSGIFLYKGTEVPVKGIYKNYYGGDGETSSFDLDEFEINGEKVKYGASMSNGDTYNYGYAVDQTFSAMINGQWVESDKILKRE